MVINIDSLSSEIRNETRTLAIIPSFQNRTGNTSQCHKPRKTNKMYKDRKGKIKTLIFTDEIEYGISFFIYFI